MQTILVAVRRRAVARTRQSVVVAANRLSLVRTTVGNWKATSLNLIVIISWAGVFLLEQAAKTFSNTVYNMREINKYSQYIGVVQRNIDINIYIYESIKTNTKPE